jgi:hypothetical protein
MPQAILTAEWQSYVDQLARRLLNISGQEFVDRWARGDYRGTGDSNVMRVASLLPIGGQD